MTQPINEKPDNSDPKELIFANMGGLPKIIQNIIDKNKNSIPDVLENIDVKKLKINGKSFNNWNQVLGAFKNLKNSSAKGQPLDITLGDKKIEQKKPALITIDRNQKTKTDSMQATHTPGQKPIKIGGSFTFLKILLALAAVGIIIYYISKMAS